MNRLFLEPSTTEKRAAALSLAGLAGGLVAGALAATLLYLGDGVHGWSVLAAAVPFLLLAALVGWLAERLRTSEIAYRRVIQTANEGIWIVDADGVTRFVNDRMLELLGVEASDVVGRPVPYADARDRLERRRRGESEQYDVELRRGDGTKMWALVSGSPVHDVRGRYVGSLAMVTDISERKRAEEMLEEAQRIAHVGSWAWDVDANVLTWSDELYRIHGLDPGGLPPSFDGFLERVHPDDRAGVREVVERAYETHEPFSLTHRIVRPDGTVRVLEASGAVHVDGEGHVVRMTGVAHDVTDRHAAEQGLAAARLARRQATELNDNVVQGLALAKYALARGDAETAARMIDGTLGQARRMISDLIGAEPVEPGDLRREQAVGLDR